MESFSKKRKTADRSIRSSLVDDRISELPAPILHHILSFLDHDDKQAAARTCVLSKSWRHLWCTRPDFSLSELSFIKDKQKFFDEELSSRKGKQFIDVLERSFQVHYDRKLCFDDFRVRMYMVESALVLLLEKWIPIVPVKKLHLSFKYGDSDTTLPSAVFESKSLQELFLKNCTFLRQIVGNNNLKTLHLKDVCIEEEESFVKFLSSSSLIEDLSLCYCKGLRTIDMPNHHNLKSFEVEKFDDGSNIEIYLPSSIGRISIRQCPNWYHHRNYFPGLTCLELFRVPLSNEWFNRFSRNFPCLEDLHLFACFGFDELQLSSRSIKKLDITMHESPTTKSTIDAPSIKEFKFRANISQSICFTATTSSEWNSEIDLFLDDLDASQWFLKISEYVAAFSQSHIISLSLNHYSDIEHYPWDISICGGGGGGSYKPVAIKNLYLNLSGVYYDFFFYDLVFGLFRFVRPREIIQFGKDEFVCRTLQTWIWEEDEEEDEGKRLFWQQDLEEVSLQVQNGKDEKWCPVEETTHWSEFVKKGRHSQLHFGLKWRE